MVGFRPITAVEVSRYRPFARPLLDHPVPDIARLAARKKRLGAAGARESACSAFVLGIDCSVIDR
jgi:hypothetical protein